MTDIEIVAQLEATLEAFPRGYADLEAIKAFDALLKDLELITEAPTSLITEKTNSIRGWVSVLYIQRKRQKHCGAETVGLYIRQDLVSLRTIILSSRKQAALLVSEELSYYARQ